MSKLKLPKFHPAKILSIFFFLLLLGGYSNIFAIGSKYAPGTTLDPACVPGEINCTVEILTGGSSYWTQDGNNIYYNNGNVGIGTDSPTKKLSVLGGVLISGGESGAGIFELVTKDSLYVNSGTPRSVAVSGNYTYVTSSSTNTLTIFNTSNPDNIVLINSTSENLTSPVSVAISGNYAYVVNSGQDLVVYNISDPANIIFVTAIASYFVDPRFITISGNYAFIADSGNYSVVVFDISDPENISFINDFSSEFSPISLAVSGDYVYVIDDSSNGSTINGGIISLDISDINNIIQGDYIGGISNSIDGPNSIAVSGNYAYVTNIYNSTLVVINISDPNSMYVVDTITTPYAQYGGVVVSGNYAYVGENHDSLYAFDISNPNNISQIDSIANNNIACITGLAYLNNYVYAIDGCSNSLNIFYSGQADGTALDVSGGVAIGEYSLNSPAPTNGLIVSGNVGIGNDSPTAMLDIKINSQINYYQGFYESDGLGDSLDDATASGEYTGSGSNGIYVWIDSEGSPDTFSYSDDNGDCSEVTGVPITGGVQNLCLGISIQFDAVTGHSLYDEWYYGIDTTIANSHPLTIRDSNNIYFDLDIENNGLSIGGVDYILPFSQAISYGQVLKNDGDGGLYWDDDLSTGGPSPISAVGTYGLSTSAWGAGTADNSNFLGYSAGSGSSYATYSNFLGREAGVNASGASNSNFIGYFAGNNATGSNYSNFFGDHAGFSALYASVSNFIGLNAGSSAVNASHSNFFGSMAGYQATNASLSNFFGFNAGRNATNAKNSIFIGQNTGLNDNVNNTVNGLSSILIGSFTNTGGFSNSILLGSGENISTPISNTKANQFMLAPSVTEMRLRGIDYTLPSSQGGTNTVLTNNGSGVLIWGSVSGGGSGLLSDADFNTKGGTEAGFNYVAGAQNNTFLGYQAGRGGVVTNAADNNTAIGYQSLLSNITGNQNSALGMNSLLSNTSGIGNSAQGFYSLLSNTTGSTNTAIGAFSISSNTIGNNNTAQGYQSLYSNKTGSHGVAVGYGSQLNVNDTNISWINYNTSIGYQSLRGSAIPANNTGNYNTAIGYQTLFNNTTGDFNSALGITSLYSNTTGRSNTAQGVQSLYSNTTGIQNSAIGSGALGNNSTGSSNSALGTSSLYSNTTGYENSAVGMQSLMMNTTGNYNSALGSGALSFNTTGSNNSALGHNSGKFTALGGNNENSSYSLYLGYDTRAGAGNNQNEIVIGSNTIGNGSNTATIGTGNVLYIGGSSISGKVARFTNNTGYCDISPQTSSLVCSSDYYLKKNITTLDTENNPFILNEEIISPGTILEKILALTPVIYNWNTEGDTDSKHIGFIAQEVEQIFPDVVMTDSETDLKSIAYTNLIPYTIKAIQEMDLKVKDFSSFDLYNANSLAYLIKNYLADVGNGLEIVFFGEVRTKKLCLDDLCIDKTQLEQLLNNANINNEASDGVEEEESDQTVETEENETNDTAPDPDTSGGVLVPEEATETDPGENLTQEDIPSILNDTDEILNQTEVDENNKDVSLSLE